MCCNIYKTSALKRYAMQGFNCHPVNVSTTVNLIAAKNIIHNQNNINTIIRRHVFNAISYMTDKTNFVETTLLNTPEGSAGQSLTTIVVPVIDEQLTVNKVTIETGKVVIQKTIEEINEVLNIPLLHDEYAIERTPFNTYIDNAPQMRQEDDTIVIPVVKEIMIKQLVLAEEIRITKRVLQTTGTETVTLRQEKVSVTHTPLTE